MGESLVREHVAERTEREDTHREAAFHVAGATSAQPAMVAVGDERWRGPHVRLVRGHDIDMPVEEQVGPALATLAPRYQVVAARVWPAGHARAGQPSDILRDGQPLQLEPEGGQLGAQDLEGALLLTHGAGLGDQPAQECERLLRVSFDGAVERRGPAGVRSAGGGLDKVQDVVH